MFNEKQEKSGMNKLKAAGLSLKGSYCQEGKWYDIPEEAINDNGFFYEKEGAAYSLRLTETEYGCDWNKRPLVTPGCVSGCREKERKLSM